MLCYKGKKVAILGLSVEGQDSVRFFVENGADVLCCDRRNEEELVDTYRVLKNYPVSFKLGPDYLVNLERYDIFVRTPGMSLRLPELIELRRKGKEITSLTKIFFDHCRAPIIGVTSTKGKGTTSTLIYEMLRKYGKHVYLGGNVGNPLLSKVDSIKQSDWVILELSSFQLEDLHRSPHIAVVLRTSVEHLANFDPLSTNFHKTRLSYVSAKKSIVRYQKKDDFAILHWDDKTSRSFASETSALVSYISFFVFQKEAYINKETLILQVGKNKFKVCDLDSINLRGIHNLENIAFASLASLKAGVSISAIRCVAKTFKGLEHRLEFVRKTQGVSYYNDTFSTVPETTIAAVRSFKEPVILIVGGSEKKSDFTEMGRIISQSSVKTLIIVGDMTHRILNSVKKAQFKGKILYGYKNMPEIVQVAKEESQKGDIVLLSPACASFDMFKNYKDRGMQFKYEVNHL